MKDLGDVMRELLDDVEMQNDDEFLREKCRSVRKLMDRELIEEAKDVDVEGKRGSGLRAQGTGILEAYQPRG